ncbi:hypothetical protein D3C81_2290650 [compost metagenome]
MCCRASPGIDTFELFELDIAQHAGEGTEAVDTKQPARFLDTKMVDERADGEDDFFGSDDLAVGQAQAG